MLQDAIKKDGPILVPKIDNPTLYQGMDLPPRNKSDWAPRFLALTHRPIPNNAKIYTTITISVSGELPIKQLLLLNLTQVS